MTTPAKDDCMILDGKGHEMASSDWYTIHYLQLVTTPAKDDCMILDAKGCEMVSYVSLAGSNPEKAKN